MMKILCAFDKFKGTASAQRVGEACINGCRSAMGSVGDGDGDCVLSMSDGGEGFLKVYEHIGRKVVVVVTNPLCTKTTAHYLVIKDGTTAVIESAAANGLYMVPQTSRNPMNTTSYGVGEMMMHAIKSLGCTKIILGLGGSSTNEAGISILQALGVQVILSSDVENGGGEYLQEPFCGRHLSVLSNLNIPQGSEVERILNTIELTLACDVTNPFVGPMGAVTVFSPQKGSTPETRNVLEHGMNNVVSIVKRIRSIDISDIPGAGAAGGICGTLHSMFRNSSISRGVDVVSTIVSLDQHVSDSDVVFTGEGGYDDQSMHGKVVSRVIDACQRYNKRCIIICGNNTSTVPPPCPVYALVDYVPLERAMTDTAECVSLVAARAMTDALRQ